MDDLVIKPIPTKILWTLILPMLLTAFFVMGLMIWPRQANAQACTRQQATCNAMVVGSRCLSNTCPTSYWCTYDNPTCCYVEWGWCDNNMNEVTISAICGGLCGRQWDQE